MCVRRAVELSLATTTLALTNSYENPHLAEHHEQVHSACGGTWTGNQNVEVENPLCSQQQMYVRRAVKKGLEGITVAFKTKRRGTSVVRWKWEVGVESIPVFRVHLGQKEFHNSDR